MSRRPRSRGKHRRDRWFTRAINAIGKGLADHDDGLGLITDDLTNASEDR